MALRVQFVGTQALDLIFNNNNFEVSYLSAHSNYKLLAEQAIKFNVETICISDDKFLESFKK